MSDFAKERSYDQNNCNRLTLLSASEDNELPRNQEKFIKSLYYTTYTPLKDTVKKPYCSMTFRRHRLLGDTVG